MGKGTLKGRSIYLCCCFHLFGSLFSKTNGLLFCVLRSVLILGSKILEVKVCILTGSWNTHKLIPLQNLQNMLYFWKIRQTGCFITKLFNIPISKYFEVINNKRNYWTVVQLFCHLTQSNQKYNYLKYWKIFLNIKSHFNRFFVEFLIKAFQRSKDNAVFTIVDLIDFFRIRKRPLFILPLPKFSNFPLRMSWKRRTFPKWLVPIASVCVGFFQWTFVKYILWEKSSASKGLILY